VILASPAARTVQTVEALAAPYRVIKEIAPGADVSNVLNAVAWPSGIAPMVVVVGHQPVLGNVVSYLLTGHATDWTIKKGGLWWLSHRGRKDNDEVIVRAVMSPDLA
jgi:phosphohistidine phosphatase